MRVLYSTIGDGVPQVTTSATHQFGEETDRNGTSCRCHSLYLDGKPRHSVYVTEQLEDYRTVIKFCRQQAEFDPHRVILWGSSLSGGHVVSLASEKHLNICAGVAQCPYLGVIAKSPLTLSAIKTLGWAVLDILKQAIGLSPIFIPAVAENGTVGVLTSPGTFEGAYALVENDGDYPNEISASSIFELPFYKPNVSAKDIACPLLVVALEHDNICSIDGAREVAAACDKVKLKVLDGGHFEAYPGQALFEESLKTQVAFLLEACPP
ncbi:hypothetical protein K474DRAFT_1663328 [Panus rudis PR-1116 ss-1]|nr:hypothetical protein K474DRAFT_1663328 [Panus rudis PR-1116 ss-1]